MDYRVDVYLARLSELQGIVLHASVMGGLVALLAGVLLARWDNELKDCILFLGTASNKQAG